MAPKNCMTRICFIVFLKVFQSVQSFAGSENQATPAFDRFSVKCPADIDSVRKFNSKLLEEFDAKDNDVSQHTWVCVFRSNNNLPSVAREDFLSAMQVATNSDQSMKLSSIEYTDKIESYGGNQKPVAVARLRPLDSQKKNSGWMMDRMQCSLKKETQDPNCDGGSEHTEALGICIDELMKYHLSVRSELEFSGAIRCKATLISAKLLEARGFAEVEKLGKDMASHVSSSNALLKYSERLCDFQSAPANSPQISDRTLKIISLLSKSDDEKEKEVVDEESGTDDEYDPFASVKSFVF